MLKMLKNVSYKTDGCGNITFHQIEISISDLIAVAKEEYPTRDLSNVVVGTCEEGGRSVMVMTFHHCE